MKRKISSVVLALAVTLMLVPVTAQAETSTSVSTYAELVQALENSGIQEVTITDMITIPKGATLDGKGKTVTVAVPGTNASGVINENPSTHSVFEMSDNSTIRNLIIKGGEKSAITNSAENVSLEGVSVVQSGSGLCSGGAVNNSSGSMVMKNCSFMRTVSSYGGAILNSSGATLIMDNCTIAECRNIGGGSNGGGACENSGTLYLNNCTLANNQSTEIGGAINNYRGTLYVANTTITGNISYGSGSNKGYGGGIGNNKGTVCVVNSIISDNYVSTDGKTYTSSDIGFYSGDSVSVYNSVVGVCTGSSGQRTPAVNVNSLINTALTGIFNNYTSADVLSPEGAAIDGYNAYTRPSIVRQKNGLYITPLSIEATADVIDDYSTTVYFDYSDLGDIRLGYGTADIISLSTNAPDAATEVTSFEDGSTRITPMVGAAPKTATQYYMVRLIIEGDGAVDGLSVYGETVAKGTVLNLMAIPEKSFVKWQLSKDGVTFADVESDSETLSLTVTEDVTVKLISKEVYSKRQPAAGAIDITEVPTEEKVAVWGKITPLDLSEGGDDVVISVNLSWGNLQYDYVPGAWDPGLLVYEEGSWSPAESGVSDKLTMENRSNVGIMATLTFANSQGVYQNIETNDVFYSNANYTYQLYDGRVYLDSPTWTWGNVSGEAFLKIAGVPTSLDNQGQYTSIGTVTVSLSQY